MLDQDQILDAIDKHLDNFNDIVKWTLFLALIFWWAGIQRQDSIHALDITVSRRQGLFVAIAAFFLANVLALNRIARIGELLLAIAPATVDRAITRLALNSSIHNPFAFFGDSRFVRWHSSGGFGFLILIWWVCNSTIYALADDIKSPAALFLQGLFLVIGLSALVTINKVIGLISQRLREVDSALYPSFEAMRLPRAVGCFLGIVGGFLIALLTQGARFL
jgi:hypothetical protein